MTRIMVIEDADGFLSNGLSAFEITQGMRPEAKGLRLILGTCQVANTLSGSTTRVSTNFLESPEALNEQSSLSFLDSFQEVLSVVDYDSYLRTSPARNLTFYNEFVDEMVVACCAAENGNGVVSFLHLYRAYERISYAFPLIYAAKTKDYIGSFGKIKQWLSDKQESASAAGELGFFKNFIDAFYDADERDVTTDFQFIGPDELRQSQFSLVKNDLLKWSAEDVTPGTIDGEKISVRFGQLHLLLLSARNRYFHQMSGRGDNIRQARIVDCEVFFNVLSKPFVTYISKLFHDVVVFDMKSS